MCNVPLPCIVALEEVVCRDEIKDTYIDVSSQSATQTTAPLGADGFAPGGRRKPHRGPSYFSVEALGCAVETELVIGTEDNMSLVPTG